MTLDPDKHYLSVGATDPCNFRSASEYAVCEKRTHKEIAIITEEQFERLNKTLATSEWPVAIYYLTEPQDVELEQPQ